MNQIKESDEDAREDVSEISMILGDEDDGQSGNRNTKENTILENCKSTQVNFESEMHTCMPGIPLKHTPVDHNEIAEILLDLVLIIDIQHSSPVSLVQ
jgi:hypothetical protein